MTRTTAYLPTHFAPLLFSANPQHCHRTVVSIQKGLWSQRAPSSPEHRRPVPPASSASPSELWVPDIVLRSKTTLDVSVRLALSRTADTARVQANTELLSDKTEPVLWLNKRTERLAHVIANHKDATVGSSAECADYAPKRGRVATLRGPRNFHLQSRSHCRRSAPELQKPCRVGLLLRNAFPALDDHLVEGCEPLLYWRLDWSIPTSADGKDPAKLETCEVIAGATVWAKGAHPT